MYMKSSEGDPNKVLIAYSLIYMLPLSAKIPFNWRELTPVSVVALDQFVLWDNADAADKTREGIHRRRQGRQLRRSRWAAPARSARTTCSPCSWRRRPARSSPICPTSPAARRRPNWSAITPQSNVNNPSENLEVWRAGQVRALCVFDKERISYKTKVTETQSWNDIPTCKEEGLDVQYLMLRAMFLPGKVTPEQTGVLRRSVPEGDADRRNTRTTWKSRR